MHLSSSNRDRSLPVLFEIKDLVEAKGMFEALVEKEFKFPLTSQNNLPLTKTGSTYYIVKSSNSSTIDDDDQDIDSNGTDEDQSRANKRKSKQL